jgi:hypothetical protein
VVTLKVLPVAMIQSRIDQRGVEPVQSLTEKAVVERSVFMYEFFDCFLCCKFDDSPGFLRNGLSETHVFFYQFAKILHVVQ